MHTLPIGRLAPSPTGLLHLGHARSFLLAWWHIRSRKGRVHLRIEDLDGDRSKPELVDTCLRDLEWLGLDWDGPVLFQSADTTALERAADDLLARGLAYPCVCTRAEIADMSAPHAGDRETPYPGTCRGRWPTPAEAERATGRRAGLRALVPAGTVTIDDLVCGQRSFDVAAEVGDILIRRRDGIWAYQLAVVVDDDRQGVNEVLRGDDLLPSAARQWQLSKLCGLAPPRWAHVPLVVHPSGERLSKRRKDLALAHLRESGVDPRAVVAWAARSAGQTRAERCTPPELLGDFDLARLPRHAEVLDEGFAQELMQLR
jgi:glutamyl-tRNA synthetase